MHSLNQHTGVGLYHSEINLYKNYRKIKFSFKENKLNHSYDDLKRFKTYLNWHVIVGRVVSNKPFIGSELDS